MATPAEIKALLDEAVQSILSQMPIVRDEGIKDMETRARHRHQSILDAIRRQAAAIRADIAASGITGGGPTADEIADEVANELAERLQD